MGKREELIQNLEIAISVAENKENKSLFVQFPGNKEYGVEFDDEQPKIMSVDGILEKYGHRDGEVSWNRQCTLVEKAWDESAKRFQPLVHGIKKRSINAPTVLDREIFKELLEMVIK